MDCTCNEINIHKLISLRFNMHIGAGRGVAWGDMQVIPLWDIWYGGTYAIVGQLAYCT